MFFCMYAAYLFIILQHGNAGLRGFALHYQSDETAAQIRHLSATFGPGQGILMLIGFGTWIFLTLKGKSSLPRWAAILPILITVLGGLLSFVPAPLGFTLRAGWAGIESAIFWTILALTYKVTSAAENHQIQSPLATTPRTG